MKSALQPTLSEIVFDMHGPIARVKIDTLEVVIERGAGTVTVSLYPERDGDFQPIRQVYATFDEAADAPEISAGLFN